MAFPRKNYKTGDIIRMDCSEPVFISKGPPQRPVAAKPEPDPFGKQAEVYAELTAKLAAIRAKVAALKGK